MPTPTTTPTTQRAAFGGVDTPSGDSSNSHAAPKHSPRESRDHPPLMSPSYPITLKVLYYLLITNTITKTKQKY